MDFLGNIFVSCQCITKIKSPPWKNVSIFFFTCYSRCKCYYENGKMHTLLVGSWVRLSGSQVMLSSKLSIGPPFCDHIVLYSEFVFLSNPQTNIPGPAIQFYNQYSKMWSLVQLERGITWWHYWYRLRVNFRYGELLKFCFTCTFTDIRISHTTR